MTVTSTDLLSGLSDQAIFKLTVIKPSGCVVTGINNIGKSTRPRAYDYTIGQGPLVIPFPTYQVEPVFCYRNITFEPQLIQIIAGRKIRINNWPDWFAVNTRARIVTIYSDKIDEADKTF